MSSRLVILTVRVWLVVLSVLIRLVIVMAA